MIKEINEFASRALSTMDEATREAWKTLSDEEKKEIAASAFFFKKNLEEAK